MERAIPVRSVPRLSDAVRFVAIGIMIYLALLAGAEWLVWRNGHMNPILKVERAHEDQDWVILGASHAMPFDYDDFDQEMETAAGQRILNLAGPGAGPVYNRFVLEHYLAERKVRNVLYVVDSFAFRSPQWNEARLADPELLAWTPLDLSAVVRLATYVRLEGADPRAVLDYIVGFSKLNNRDRFVGDMFEGEAQFDRVFRPSATADRKRVEYLYPAVENERAARDRYFATLAALAQSARSAGATVTLAKFPVPARFAALLPDEAGFDADLRAFAAADGLQVHDFSAAVQGKEYFADTDHLNRAGAQTFLAQHLRALLRGETVTPAAVPNRPSD